MTRLVDFTGIEELEGDELKATLQHLNEALDEQRRLVREVAQVKRTNRILTWVVGLILVLTVVAGAAVVTAVRASFDSREATEQVRAATESVLAVREQVFYDNCVEYNQRRDFDEQVLHNDAFPPKRDRTTVEEVPNLTALDPELQALLVFLDSEGDKNEVAEAERLEVKQADLEEFKIMFPRRDCLAESAERIERIDPSIRPEVDVVGE
jgi:hypothetical protein